MAKRPRNLRPCPTWRGYDSDGSACVDGARVSVQEPVTFRDWDISRGQQIALDNFVEASGHVNTLFDCAKFGQTARYCKPQTVSHVCGSSSTVSSVNVGYLQEGGET